MNYRALYFALYFNKQRFGHFTFSKLAGPLKSGLNPSSKFGTSARIEEIYSRNLFTSRLLFCSVLYLFFFSPINNRLRFYVFFFNTANAFPTRSTVWIFVSCTGCIKRDFSNRAASATQINQ